MCNISFSVSTATKQNWERLGVENYNERLSKRANKTQSSKRFIPMECLHSISSATIKNVIHIVETENVHISDALFSLAYKKIHRIINKKGKEWFYEQYSHLKLNDSLFSLAIPDAQEFLGTVYQSLLTEGEKNKRGSYYTPRHIVEQMISNFNFDNNQKIIDPACGSGAFLLSLSCENPNLIYGVDNDPIAVMITCANLLFKYSTIDFLPNIIEMDFLSAPSLFDAKEQQDFRNMKFDYIVTNPPWGSAKRSGLVHNNLFSDELFSCFLFESLNRLKTNGYLSFLLPYSFLNVKNHSNIRKYIYEHCCIEKITSYPNVFSNVITEFVSVSISNKARNDCFVFADNEKNERQIKYKKTPSYTIDMNTDKDNEIIRRVRKKGEFTLSKSIWGLGIVTGDNKNKLFDMQIEGSEPIYTGKEVKSFVLSNPRKYVVYDRTNFQQAAKDEIYRAKEKLIYKFISKKLVFAYDDKQSLCLNSANILIPNIPSLSIKSVMALLNSKLYQFIYAKSFGQIKILKGNICELKFPKLTSLEDKELSDLVFSDKEMIDAWIYDYYSISLEEQLYIEKEI